MPHKIQTPEIRCGDCCLTDESRTIEGYALIFNTWSKYMAAIVNNENRMFREIILPGSIDGLIDKSDVTANFNHDEDDGILARSRNGSGTLSLMVDQNGLKYSFSVPDTTLGEDVFESMKRGDINASSFAFIVDPKGDKWEKNSDGTFNRTISKILVLQDIAVVVRPAYPGAFASTRSIEAIEEIELKEDLENYYTELQKQYI